MNKQITSETKKGLSYCHLGCLVAVLASGVTYAEEQPKKESTELSTLVVEGKRDEKYAVKRNTLATKTDTALIDTPQSVSVLTQEFLKDTSVNSIGDAVRYVPGVGTAQGEGNRDTIVFRGNSSTGDYFVDGLRDDTQYYRDFYNIDTVEVLKGSSGMIFGRGGPGGVLNRASKQAVVGGKSFYETTGLVGSWDQYRSTVDVNQALTLDASLRITGVYENSDSYRDGVYNERQGINPTFGWAITDKTTLRVGIEYFNDERTADRGIPSFNGKPYHTDEATFFGDPDRSPTDTELHALNFSIDHEFDNGTTLRNAFRYASYDKFYQNVFTAGPVTAGTVAMGAYNNATDRENFINQTDVVFKFDTGSISHTLLTGLELSRQETDNFRKTGYSDAGLTMGLAPVLATNPRYTGPIFWGQSVTDSDNNSVAEDVAIYVQDQIQLLPKLQFIGGVRLDHLQVDYHNNRTGENLDSSDDLFSPRAGLVYKPVENVALYGSYTFSYIPRAGEQLGSLSAANEALDPEEFENFEIGAKWDVTSRMSLTAAAYQLQRSNQAITDPADPTKLILVDGQEVKGIELTASGQITDQWSLIAGYAYQEGETQSDVSATVLAGMDIQQLPQNTFSLWNRYDFNEHWGVGVGAIYRDGCMRLPTT